MGRDKVDKVLKKLRSKIPTPPIGPLSVSYWPAPGSDDTELGVLMELEVGHGETEV